MLKALDEKKLAGAALDVVEEEPLPDGHPLFGRKDVLVTPHLSGRTTMVSACLLQQRNIYQETEVAAVL